MTLKFFEQGPSLTSIGIDIGKDVFYIVGFDREGRIALRRKIRRLALVKVFEKLAAVRRWHGGMLKRPFCEPYAA